MDRGGETLTTVGYILGIVSSVVMLLGAAAGVLVFILMIGIEGSRAL